MTNKNPNDVVSTPQAGTRSNSKKNSNDPLDSRRKNQLPKAKNVVDAKEVPGAHKRAVDAQVGNDANPHKRDEATWGISRESLKTAKKLK